MRVVNVRQGTEAWKRWRDLGEGPVPKVGIGASGASTVVGVSAYKSRWRLSQELAYAYTDGETGRPPEDLSNNPLVIHGKELEDRARSRIEAHLDDALLPLCAESSRYPFLRASLDGYTADRKTAEIKCPSGSVFRDVLVRANKSDAYLHYWWQVQHQSEVIEASEGFLFFWLEAKVENGAVLVDGKPIAASDVLSAPLARALKDGKFSETLSGFGCEATLHVEAPQGDRIELWLEFGIPRDDKALADYIVKAAEFVANVEAGTPEPKDPMRDPFEPETPDDEARWAGLADQWRKYRADQRLLEVQQEYLLADRAAIDGKLQAASFPYPWGEYGGCKLTRYWQKGNVDTGAAIAGLGLNPDLCDEFRSKGRLQTRVTDQTATVSNYRDGDDDEEDLPSGEANPVIREFWKDMLAGKDSKELAKEEGYQPDSSIEQAQWLDWGSQRDNLDDQLGKVKKAIKDLGEKRKQIEKTMSELMGIYSTAQAAGLLVSKFFVDGKVNLPALLKSEKMDASALEPYRGEGNVRYRVAVQKREVVSMAGAYIRPIQLEFTGI
jgi:putative phage-type endonuclease